MQHIDPDNPRLTLTAAGDNNDELRAVARGLFGGIRQQQAEEAAKMARLCNRAALELEKDRKVFGKDA